MTGDQPLLGLGAYQGVAIVSPRVFLDILSAQKEVSDPAGDPEQ